MRRMRRRRGSVSADALLALAAVLICLPLTASVIQTAFAMVRFDEEVQDETALLQLRRILTISYDLHTDGQTLYFRHERAEKRLSKVNDHLIIQPGTVVILADIGSARFYSRSGVLFLQYERKGKTYERALARIPQGSGIGILPERISLCKHNGPVYGTVRSVLSEDRRKLKNCTAAGREGYRGSGGSEMPS